LEYPTFIDYFVRWKEDNGDIAEALADERVRSSSKLYLAQVREFVSLLQRSTGFYQIGPSDTLEEARQRVAYLKDVIENKGGHRLFYVDGQPIRREADLHILFRLTWFGTTADVNPEVDGGRGPADFAVSKGRFDKTLVEFKLAKSTSLARNLQNQTDIYERSLDAKRSLKVIVYFTAEELKRVRGILLALRRQDDDPDIILVDARSDNKPSGSTA
jgi:hypothetical protein